MRIFKRSALFCMLAAFSFAAAAQDRNLNQWVQVDNVLLESQPAAAYALQLVQGGMSLNLVAARWSLDPTGYGAAGGQLQVAKCSDYVPEFAIAVCTAQIGETGMVKTAFGWHLYRVNARSSQRELVPAPEALGIAPFASNMELACAFTQDASKSFQLSLDRRNAAAKLGSRPALLIETDTHLRLLIGDMSQIQVDRTTGLGYVQSRDGAMVGNINCRPASQRLF